MRNYISLAAMAATTACAALYPTTQPQPRLTPRSLDTTIAVGTPEDRRFLARQLQLCYVRQIGSLQSDEDERTRAQRTRALIIGGVGVGSALIVWLALRHPALGATGGLGIALIGGSLLRAVGTTAMPTTPASMTEARERVWFDVVTHVEAWETAARDLAGAQRNIGGSQGASPQGIDPLTTVWQHADNALRSAFTTCLP